MDRVAWPAHEGAVRRGVRRARPAAEWEAIFEGSDACVAPVLSMAEAPEHPHNRFRETFTEVAGVVQPVTVASLHSHPGLDPHGPHRSPGQHGDEALAEWGLSEEEIGDLRSSGAIC